MIRTKYQNSGLTHFLQDLAEAVLELNAFNIDTKKKKKNPT